MKIFSKIMLVIVCGGLSIPVFAGDADPLFINLTTSNYHRAEMAIGFGANQHKLGHPLTLFLNDKGVMIASKLNALQYPRLQKTLESLVEQHAVILVCPTCMKHYGIKESELLPGLKVGNPKLTGPQLFQDNTKTLTW